MSKALHVTQLYTLFRDLNINYARLGPMVSGAGAMEERLLCARLLPRFVHDGPVQTAKCFDTCLKLANQERKDSRTAGMVPRVRSQALDALHQLCLSVADALDCRGALERAVLELLR